MSAAGARPVAVLLTGCAFVCSPPIAGALLALEPLHPDDTLGGWCLAGGLLGIAWLGIARTARARVVQLALVATTLIAAEIGARLVVRWATDWPRQRLAALARVTYPDLILFRAHPFLHFTGRPGGTLRGNSALAGDSPFNARGFFGPEFPTSKPDGTCRVVCLGASTTASGYPARMQAWLNARAAPGRTFECVNLAHGFYNSNHSVVNFALNALDLEPDYVVVHHGWNDARAAANAAEYRGDHAHVLKAFEPPAPPDWLLIRASVLYRFARHRILGASSEEYLEAAATRPFRAELGHDLELAAATFRRNVETIVDVARSRGIRPVLATLPRGVDPSLRFAEMAPELDRLAAELRAIAAERSADVVLVDLAADWPDRAEWFKDVGHLNEAGIAHKAERIGQAVLDDLRR